MKVIELTRGFAAIVDDEDFERLAQWRWHLASVGYAMRRIRNRKVLMHRIIIGEGNCWLMDIDHKNGNRLDNRRCNLRVCTRSQNQQNRRMMSNNTSGYKGVCWDTQAGKFRARIHLLSGKSVYLGVFDKAEDAGMTYNAAAIKHFGEFARIN